MYYSPKTHWWLIHSTLPCGATLSRSSEMLCFPGMTAAKNHQSCWCYELSCLFSNLHLHFFIMNWYDFVIFLPYTAITYLVCNLVINHQTVPWLFPKISTSFLTDMSSRISSSHQLDFFIGIFVAYSSSPSLFVVLLFHIRIIFSYLNVCCFWFFLQFEYIFE